MDILLEDIGKRYQRNWIFKNLSFQIESGDCIAITGINGSGKSTLLKIISTYIDPTQGEIKFSSKGSEIKSEEIPVRINYAAPYVNLIEELTLKEHLEFHSVFKNSILNLKEIAKLAGLEKAWNKTINVFSSGMKQRLKLAMAFYFTSDLILLDEPTSNMDEQGIDWYLSEVQKIKTNQTVLIASNQRYEYDFSNKELKISDYKKLKKAD